MRVRLPQMRDVRAEELLRMWSNQLFDGRAPDVSTLHGHPMMQEQLLSHTPFAVAVFDYARLQFAYVSTNFRHHFGYEAEALQEGGIRFLFDRLHTDDVGPYQTVIQQAWEHLLALRPAQRRNAKYSVVYRLAHPVRNEFMWVLHQNVVLHMDANGSVVYTLGVLTNITPYKLDSRVNGTFQHEDERGELVTLHLPEMAKMLFTRREQEILRLLASGMSSRTISQTLGIAADTVISHRKRMLVKSNCKNSAELVRFSLEHGLL